MLESEHEAENVPAAPLEPPAEPAPGDNDLAELRALFADLSDRRQRAFLAGFVVGKGLKRAAELSGLSRWCHYQWMRKDELYGEHFRLAREIVADEAEEEAYRRAFLGYDTPVVFGGKITAWYKSYSDALAQFLLKGIKPEVYRRSANDDFLPGPTEINIRVAKPKDQQTPDAELVRTISIPHPRPRSEAARSTSEERAFDSLKEKL